MEERALKTSRILILDDEPANVRLLERLLERAGYAHFRSTTDSRQALPLYAELQPDLILLDMHLPDLPGDEELRQLRADPRTAAIPVVVISADATPGQIQRLRAAGAHDYLTKPLDLKKCLEVLDETLTEGAR